MPERTAHILVVEDEKPLMESVKLFLEDNGYVVDGVETGVQAIEKLKDMLYDIIIVDFRLPDMTGIELIKQALQISKDTVPIVTTGYSSLETAVESMRVGTHDYLVKPVNPEDLMKCIEHILDDREALLRGKKGFPELIKKIGALDDRIIEVIVSGSEAGRAARKQSGVAGSMSSGVKGMFSRVKRFYWD